MHFGTIKNCDIANGEGVRVSLFVSGCTNHCEHCFQPQTWAFDYGEPITPQTEETILELLSPDYINGLTLLDLADRVGTRRTDGDLHQEGCTCGCCHGADKHHHHHTAGEYTCCSGETDRFFDEEEIRGIKDRLTKRAGGDVFRAKGILPGKDRGWRFDYVDGEFSAEAHPPVSSGKYVFIGKEIDKDFWQSLMQ